MSISTLAQQVTDAKKNVAHMKKHTPWLFQQWQDLERAKTNLVKARLELERAQEAWRKL